MDSIVIILLVCIAVIAVAMVLFVVLMNRERTRLIAEKSDIEQRLTAEKNAIIERSATERTVLETRHATERTALEEQLRDKIAEIAALRTRIEQNDSEREKMEEQFKAQFRNLANDILGEQSRQFRQTNKDEIDKLLKPFRDNITDFRERVERIYSSENEQRGALRNELENLMKLNARITTETANLTQALKGNSKVQWLRLCTPNTGATGLISGQGTPQVSLQFSHSVVSDSLRPHESQHSRPPCPSPSPGVHSYVHRVGDAI